MALAVALSAPALAQSNPRSPSASASAAVAPAAAAKPVAKPASGEPAGAPVPAARAADPRVAEAVALHESADYLARTRRVRGAVVRYRRALGLYKLAGDPRTAEIEQKIVSLAKSSGTLQIDTSAVSTMGYLEVAADGFVVSRRNLARGVTLPAGDVLVTARRPGCATWSKKVRVPARRPVAIKVPALVCGGGQ